MTRRGAQAVRHRLRRRLGESGSLGLRVGVAAGAGVLVAVVALSVVVYVMVESKLREDIDESLSRRNDDDIPVDLGEAVLQRRPNDLIYQDRYLQVVMADGSLSNPAVDGPILPITDDVLAVARGEGEAYLADVEAVDGTPVRVHVMPADGAAVMFGRSLAEVESTLNQLLAVLVGAALGGLAVAFLVGRLAARTAVGPVHRMSDAAEAVARTGDLSHHIPLQGGDELARLAGSFNRMLDALDDSLRQQRQLVADASHELRTPLASVRTNVEVLQRADGAMDPVGRQEVYRDVVAQVGELTRLVEDLVELARGDADAEPVGAVALEDVVDDVVARARRHHPGLTVRVHAQPTTVRVASGRVERAVANLVDNAAKWSPSGAVVDVEVGNGTVVVSDAGPGIDPADAPHLFDRFYRSAQARGMPGSGLGLAIVKQVADAHGGTVHVDRSAAGGARFTLSLPAASPAPRRTGIAGDYPA